MDADMDFEGMDSESYRQLLDRALAREDITEEYYDEEMDRLEAEEEEGLITTSVDQEEMPVRARKTKLVGLDYSDVALLLTQYKGAMTRFAGECL